MARRRDMNVFSLSFLDVMSCGFGAIILFFMIINTDSVRRKEEVTQDLQGEVEKLEVEVLEGRKYLVELKNTIEETDEIIEQTAGRSRRVIEIIEQKRIELAELENDTVAKTEHVNKLKADLKSLEEENKRLEGGAIEAETQGDRLVNFAGDGQRQYVTGLQIAGDHLVIMLDSSASMLADRVVNVLRNRSLRDRDKIRAAKWQRAVKTVEWLSTRIPPGSKFQIVTFNEQATPVGLSGTSRWLDGNNPEHLRAAITAVRSTIPGNGTSLENAFSYLDRLTPRPDNVYLLTDGLPTQGAIKSNRATVNSRQRVRFFNDAVEELPGGVPINVVLFPMEGDPDAASLYWLLAARSNGAFFSPSNDWP